MSWEVLEADCVEALAGMDEASVDAIVTDPPAGIAFMAKSWDADKGGRDAWVKWLADVMRECYRVAKPGAHALVWALPRTSHWTGWAIEEAGWKVRDRIAHHFGSGFPKSHNLGNGFGTALKPATEDWWLARKPLIGTVAENVQRFGTGALNVDGCRIGTDERWAGGRWPANVALSHIPPDENGEGGCEQGNGVTSEGVTGWGTAPPGTPDVTHADPDGTEEVAVWDCAPGCAVAALDEQSGETTSPAEAHPVPRQGGVATNLAMSLGGTTAYGDSGGASRFFYTAKASRAERNAGLEGFEERPRGDLNQGHQNIPIGSGNPRSNYLVNSHPTVKPIALMRWLCRLVTPPTVGLICDPFTGSGTTGCAAVLEGFDFIGIEREAEYTEIARARIAWWEQHRGREAEEVLADSRRSEAQREQHEAAGQLGLL